MLRFSIVRHKRCWIDVGTNPDQFGLQSRISFSLVVLVAQDSAVVCARLCCRFLALLDILLRSVQFIPFLSLFPDPRCPIYRFITIRKEQSLQKNPFPQMSRHESYEFNPPSGGRDHRSPNLSLSGLNPPDRGMGTASSPFVPFMSRSPIVSPDSTFHIQTTFPLQDSYSGQIRGDNRTSNNTPYQGPLSVPTHPPFLPSPGTVSRFSSIGYSFGNPSAPAQYSPYHDREQYFPRPPSNNKYLPLQPPPSVVVLDPRGTLWWGDLEPWMDEEYAKQVCTIMKWDPTHIKVPRPLPDSVTGQQTNNPGHCFLSFASPARAAEVLNQIQNSKSVIMPNSSKPFVLSWAQSIPSSPPPPTFVPPPPVVDQTHP